MDKLNLAESTLILNSFFSSFFPLIFSFETDIDDNVCVFPLSIACNAIVCAVKLKFLMVSKVSFMFSFAKDTLCCVNWRSHPSMCVCVCSLVL